MIIYKALFWVNEAIVDVFLLMQNSSWKVIDVLFILQENGNEIIPTTTELRTYIRLQQHAMHCIASCPRD